MAYHDAIQFSADEKDAVICKVKDVVPKTDKKIIPPEFVTQVTVEGEVSERFLALLNEVGKISFSLRSKIARLGYNFKINDENAYIIDRRIVGGVPTHYLIVQGRIRNTIAVSPVCYYQYPSYLLKEKTKLGRFFVVKPKTQLGQHEIGEAIKDYDIDIDPAWQFDPMSTEKEGLVRIPLLPEIHELTEMGHSQLDGIIHNPAINRQVIMERLQRPNPIDKSTFSLQPNTGMIGAIQLGFRKGIIGVIQDQCGGLVHNKSQLLTEYSGYDQGVKSSDKVNKVNTVVVEVRTHKKQSEIPGNDLAVAVAFYPAPNGLIKKKQKLKKKQVNDPDHSPRIFLADSQ